MVLYYITKRSDLLSDYSFPFKEGDICLLHDGDYVKTIYLDSEVESDSIWRDFRFFDKKSMHDYQFPDSNVVLCSPSANGAEGDAQILGKLIKVCTNEWLLDFLNDTSAVLNGFRNYWDH